MTNLWAKIYFLLNSLSIPLIIGSCISLHFFSQFFAVHLPGQVYILLSLSIFIVYSLDHMFDAMAHNERASIGRYNFHLNYKKTISYAVVLAFIICIFLLFFVNTTVLKFGLIISGITVLYFFMVHLLTYKRIALLLKEPIIAIVYTIVITILPSLYLSAPFYNYLNFVQADFLLVCVLNLMVFTYYDYGIDNKTAKSSWLFSSDEISTKKTIYGFSFLFVMFSFCFYLLSDNYSLQHLFLFLSMKIYMTIIIYFQHYFAVNERHRWWGDMVFVLPFLCFI